MVTPDTIADALLHWQRSDELTLLCAAVRWPNSPAKADAISAAASRGVDWAAFHALATRHRISALAYDGLLFSRVQMDPNSRQQLRQAAERTSLLELQMAGELGRLMRALRQAGIDPVVLKGLPVAIAAFGRLGLRYNRDIDLLAPMHLVADAARVLEVHGYERVEPSAQVTPSQMKRWLQRQKDAVFIHPSGSIVELHWRLFDNPKLLDVDPFAVTDVQSVSRNLQVRVLRQDFNLIYLCLHGAQHGWSRLKWLADVAAILQSMEPEAVGEAYEWSKALGVSRAVVQASVLCSAILGATVPAAIWGDVDWRVRWLVRASIHSLFAGGAAEIEEQVAGSTGKNLSHYLLRRDFRYKLSEAVFDMTDLPSERWLSTPLLFAPFVRAADWFARQARTWRAARPA